MIPLVPLLDKRLINDNVLSSAGHVSVAALSELWTPVLRDMSSSTALSMASPISSVSGSQPDLLGDRGRREFDEGEEGGVRSNECEGIASDVTQR